MLSIIIPTLNEEKVLENTLKNLRSLDAVEKEIIVSDGGSSDRTAEIAAKYADRLIAHRQNRKQTIAEGRNAGAAAARGEFLLFLDADVHIPEINDFAVKALNLFSQRPRLAGLTVFLQVLPEHVTLSDRLFFSLVNRFHQLCNNILRDGTASGEFMMVKTQAFQKIGGFNAALAVGEDNDLFARLSRIGQTRIESGLYVLHTSRRAHQTGWPILLSLWLLNSLWIRLAKRSFSKEWKAIR